ncbi:acidPPc domain-containing protein [Gammaproteobacteria bacterium]
MWLRIVEWCRCLIGHSLWAEASELRLRLIWIVGAGGVGLLIGLSALAWWGDMAIVQDISHSHWVISHRGLIQAISDGGMYPFYVFFLAAFGYASCYRLPWPRAVALGWLWAELLGAGLAVQVIKFLAGRARPDQAWATGGIDQWLGSSVQAAYHSFPSGHTADLFVSAAFTILLVRSPWAGIFAWCAALAVALSRIALAKHYLSDVLAGVLVAEIAALLVVRQWLRVREGGGVSNQPQATS